MSTEDRLRTALQEEAARIEPREGWAAIESRLSETTPRSRIVYFVAAAAAIVLVAAAAAALQDRDDAKPVLTNPGASTTSTSTTAVAVAAAPKYIWPLDPAANYRTPETLADAFAHDFLGVSDATVTRNDADMLMGDENTYVYVRSSVGAIITTLATRQEPDGSWHALEATSDNLVIESPAKGDTITSPQTITGQSMAFEGVVHVTLYGYGGDAAHPLLGTTTFTGHGTEMGPYETSLTWKPTTDTWGLLMLWTDSARDGSLAEATVRLVRLA